jgi:preprotein translocase subunit Sss1
MTTSTPSRKNTIPASARAGLVLLILGALIVGLGSYFDRGALSLYGLIMGIVGFLIYIVSSITRARRNKRMGLKPKK